MVVTESTSDQQWTRAASWSTTAREIQAGGHHPASLTSAALPGLLSYGTSSYFIADDPSPFPSGCAQPSSTPLIKSHRPSPRSNEDTTDTGGPLGPTFVGSVYTMGDRARKQMVSLGPVQQLPSGNSLPGFLGAMNDTPIGRAVEKGLLWWVNRGRETPRFEFFLDKEAASKRVDITKAGWLLSSQVSSSTVVECPLQEAYNCTKIDAEAFKLVPDRKQVRAAKRILRRQFGWRAAKGFTGTPVFAAHNFNIVVPSVDGVRWYTPCFLDKSALHSALDRSVDLHFEGLIRTRRAQRFSSLDPGGSSGGLGAPPSDADGLEEDTSLLEPSDVKDLMEEAPSGTNVGVDKILFNLAAVYVQDLFDDVILGNKWGRSAVGLQPHFSITVDSFEDCAATAEAAAIAQERLKQELAHGSQGGAKVESSERNEGRRWGPDAFKDSGPPGSSLLGDVVREVEAKRNVGFEEGSRAGSPNQIESGSDAGMSVQADSSRSRGVAGQARGSKRGDTEGMVRRDSGDGERNEGAPEQRNGTDSGVSAPSVDDLSSQRTSGGAADKPWWDIIMDHPAFKRDGREAPSGSGRSRDGVVVNRGPGWEIVRRGPFWNRQYVLEQVAEGADAGGRPAAEGQRGLSGRQENAARGGKADAERRIGEGPVEERKESRGEGLREAKGRGDGEHDNGHVGSPPIEGHPQGAEGVSHPKYETGDSGEDPGVTSSLPGQSGRSAGMSERSEQTQAACGRFISQQEWNAVKAAVKDKLKGSAGTSADVRQQKWEALKASVEAKLALKYRERGAGWSAAGGTSTSFEVEDSTRPFGHGQVESGRRVAGEGGSVAKGKTRSLGDGVHGKKKPLEMGVQVDQRSKARHGAAEAAAGQLGVAGVVRDEARMALIAVMAGSPQERDLQGALDAVTRDIHGKSANGSEASMMFIGNVGSLFVPLGTRSGGPQAGML